MSIDVKICGIRNEAGLKAAVENGAAFVGFVFYPPSKNAVAVALAHGLAGRLPPKIIKTGLFVDADDDTLRSVTREVPLDLLQLHGKETPMRVTEIRRLTAKPVMKAIRLLKPEHLEAIAAYEDVADRLLFDSRIGDEPSGGPINWALLKDRAIKKPWMLAGGLTAQNLAEAVRVTGARAVDVSSGVEDAPGVKSPEKIKAFLRVAAALS